MRMIDADALMYEANSDGAYGYVDASGNVYLNRQRRESGE